MSNRSRGERSVTSVVNPKIKLSPDDKLLTLTLFIRYQKTNEVGRVLGISPAAVRDRLYALGVKIRTRGDIKTNVVELNGQQFLLALSTRLQAAAKDPSVSYIASRPWTDAEDALVISDTPTKDLAVLLGRSKSSIKARRLRLPPFADRQRRRRWSQSEDELVLTSPKSPAELAETMDRTRAAIGMHRYRLRHSTAQLWPACPDPAQPARSGHAPTFPLNFFIDYYMVSLVPTH